jgi:hypothetical protein
VDLIDESYDGLPEAVFVMSPVRVSHAPAPAPLHAQTLELPPPAAVISGAGAGGSDSALITGSGTTLTDGDAGAGLPRNAFLGVEAPWLAVAEEAVSLLKRTDKGCGPDSLHCCYGWCVCVFLLDCSVGSG